MKRLIAMSAALLGASLLCSPALAFDCARASTKTEKAICSDSALKAADSEMSAAYEALMQRVTGDQPKMLKASQIAWLKRRDESCSWNEQQADLVACVMDQTKNRTRILTGGHDAGPGVSAQMVPWFYSRPQSRTQCSAEVAVIKFASPQTPGQKVFNEAIEAIARTVESEQGAREASPDYEFDCYYDIAGSIPYASDEIINGNISIDTYGGGAHGMQTAQAITVDLQSGRQLAYLDVFGAGAERTLIDACTAELRKDKIARYGQAGGDADWMKEMMNGLDGEMKGYAEAIASAIKDFSRWTLSEDGATVYFPPYEVGSYAEGSYICELPKNLLQLAAGVKGWIVP